MLFGKTLYFFITAIVLAGAANLNAFNGDATWYETGFGNCGGVNKDSDHIVALSAQEYNGGSRCYKHIKVYYQGQTVDAQVVDSCPSCDRYSIDLSPSAFQALAPLAAGRIHVAWNYA